MLKFLIVLIVLAALGALVLRWGGRGAVPEAGAAAPDFALFDSAHRRHLLSEYRGRWLVLYFYPKDATPACTTEACNLRDSSVEFHARNVALLGVSLDDAASHADFVQQHHLPFPLLVDQDAKVARDYGSLWDFGLLRFAKRHTFLIDSAGRVAKVYREIDTARHAQEILADLTRFGVVAPPSGANNQSVPSQ